MYSSQMTGHKFEDKISSLAGTNKSPSVAYEEAPRGRLGTRPSHLPTIMDRRLRPILDARLAQEGSASSHAATALAAWSMAS